MAWRERYRQVLKCLQKQTGPGTPPGPALIAGDNAASAASAHYFLVPGLGALDGLEVPGLD